MLEKLKGTFDKGIAAVSVKSETLVESSRTKTAMNSAQKKMEAQMSALSMKIYQAWKAGERSLESFTADFESIQATEQEIASLSSYLEDIKREENRILGGQKQQQSQSAGGCFCTKCGKALPAGSRFCDECGTPVA